MEPHPPGTGPEAMGHLRLDLLRAAVETYLKTAYPSGEIPEVVRRRLVWPEGLAAEELLDQAAVRARREDARTSEPDLRAEARQFPLPAHEDADPAVVRTRPASCSRSIPTTRWPAWTWGPPTRRPSDPCRRRISGSRRRSSRPGMSWGCPPSSAISASTFRVGTRTVPVRPSPANRGSRRRRALRPA